jgi:hypothetical protein
MICSSNQTCVCGCGTSCSNCGGGLGNTGCNRPMCVSAGTDACGHACSACQCSSGPGNQ